MTFVALTILSVIDAVLPCTSYDTSVIWIMCTDFSYLLCIPVWSLTGVILDNAPNARGATYLLLYTLSEPCLDILNILINIINFCIYLLGVCPNHILSIHCVHLRAYVI